MVTDEPVSRTQYELYKVSLNLARVNFAIGHLQRVWAGDEFPFKTLDTTWFEGIEMGDRTPDSRLLKELAKAIKNTRVQLDASRELDSEVWSSKRVRNMSHSQIEDGLNEASTALKNAKELL